MSAIRAQTVQMTKTVREPFAIKDAVTSAITLLEHVRRRSGITIDASGRRRDDRRDRGPREARADRLEPRSQRARCVSRPAQRRASRSPRRRATTRITLVVEDDGVGDPRGASRADLRPALHHQGSGGRDGARARDLERHRRGRVRRDAQARAERARRALRAVHPARSLARVDSRPARGPPPRPPSRAPPLTLRVSLPEVRPVRRDSPSANGAGAPQRRRSHRGVVEIASHRAPHEKRRALRTPVGA